MMLSKMTRNVSSPRCPYHSSSNRTCSSSISVGCMSSPGVSAKNRERCVSPLFAAMIARLASQSRCGYEKRPGGAGKSTKGSW